LRGLHPGVCTSGTSTTSVGEFFIVMTLDVIVSIVSKDLLVVLSSLED
jgi:hypothetical protein